MNSFTIGCDPEIFVARKDRLVSAHGMVKGTKEAPQKVKDGAVQVDGMALEINTTPVDYKSFSKFNENINSVLDDLTKMLPEDAKLVLSPSVTFPEDVLAGSPPEALELGCDPDFNAWLDGAPNPRPDAAVTMRCAGGHLHMGWDPSGSIPVDHPDHLAICCEFVKTLDLYVGLGSIIIDGNPTRRELYGKAGAFRPKPYGVEYRTPSNMWLQSRQTRSFIFNLLAKAIDAQVKGSADYDWFDTNGYAKSYNIEKIINNGDQMSAYSILTQILGVSVPKSIFDPLNSKKG